MAGLFSSCFGCCDAGTDAELSQTAPKQPKGTSRVRPLTAEPSMNTSTEGSPDAVRAIVLTPVQEAAALGASDAACRCLRREDADSEVFAVGDSEWLVLRSSKANVRLRWLHKETALLSWAQPLPQLRHLSGFEAAVSQMADMAYVAVHEFTGAPQSTSNPTARTGIAGVPPDELRLHRTCRILSPEHVLYPPELFEAIGVSKIIFCEELRYNGQRRRDVPDLASGNLFIDVGDRAPRRKRHSFHHELFHLIDYRLRGPSSFTASDPEWEAHNPENFRYGSGGKYMQHDADSSQLSSAPEGGHFLNRYSTSAITEDKAEVWSALMCYDEILRTPQLRAKAELLLQRVSSICEKIDDHWLSNVRAVQPLRKNLWERVERNGGGYLHYVTGEYVTDVPNIFSLDAT